MRVLVTGGRGFIGQAVVSQLRDLGEEVITVGRASSVRSHLHTQSDGHRLFNRSDDPVELSHLLSSVAPDSIIHLAGAASASSLGELYQVNAIFAATLLQAASTLPKPPMVLLVGSAAEYGPVPDPDLPVSEDFPCRPNNPYGITKLAQTFHGLAAAQMGLPVAIARVFNPIGPSMSTSLALGSFVSQIAQFGPSGGVLRTGNLDAVRDFIDVREAARLLIEIAVRRQAIGQIFNICTGIGSSLLDVTRQLIACSGQTVELEYDVARRGNSTVSRFVGSPTKLLDMGLLPAHPDFHALLPEMLTFARSQRMSAPGQLN